ncbi:MAG: folate-binding protein, partial [Betaproteobacteria bacterium]|nr:folate-binding protein [Betaproteobacteria bacterium]
PQMLNLERIGGVSFTKGCYPGQEIVARSQHLGQVKRRLYRYRAEATRLPVIGTRIVGHDAKPAGEVLRAASLDGHRCLLLAVIPTEMQDQALTLEDGTPLHAETPTHAAS